MSTIREVLRRRWLHVLSAVTALVIIGLLILSFGNPQWNRWIHLFQAHVWCWDSSRVTIRTDGEAHLFPPKGYTGKWTAWFRNGHRWNERTYVKGNLNGEFTYWALVDGSLRETGVYRNNLPDGKVTTWFPAPDGPVPIEVTQWENGKPVSRHGFRYWYHDNGQKFGVARTVKGKRDGLETNWDENGRLAEESMWKNGKYHGRHTVYYDDGRKRREEFYENGKAVGVWKYWEEDGELIEVAQGDVADWNGETVPFSPEVGGALDGSER